MPKQDAIIQQVKRIKVLKDDGILSTDEFNEDYFTALGETL